MPLLENQTEIGIQQSLRSTIKRYMKGENTSISTTDAASLLKLIDERFTRDKEEPRIEELNICPVIKAEI